MAVRKSELGLGIQNGIQATDLQTIVSQEQDVLLGSLETGKELTKGGNLNKLSGARTKVVYFHQVPRSDNNYLVNTSGFSDADPDVLDYIKIENFIFVMEPLSTSWEEQDNGGPKSPMFDGSITILPNTILPYANDRFILNYQGRTRLFRVTEATPMSADARTAYSINCALEDNDFIYSGSNLEKMVIEDFVFEENHIGTELQTIFKKSVYKTVYNLKYLYHRIGQVFVDNFYKKEINTYIMDYENNLFDEFSTSKYFTVLTEDGVKKGTVVGSSDDPEFNSEYEGKEMYDSELIEFMLRNRIFDEIGNNRITPTQFVSNKKNKSYAYTIFNAVETRDRSRFKNRYQLPVELKIASPAAQPVMYGKYSLLHTSIRDENGVIILFPKHLSDIISNTVNDVVPAYDYRQGNVFDKITYLIALYVNKFDKHILAFLASIYDQIDDLEQFDSLILKNEVFYLYPLLGYITKKTLDKLVSTDGTSQITDPRDYYPTKKGE
jgi:hypothetical protein